MIRSVVVDAFGCDQEAKLVDELRRDGDLAVSLAAECDGAVCGYVALSRLHSPLNALALAPVAVRRAMQGKGVGAALVRGAIERARALECEIVFVLGAPEYYQRFGFSVEAAKPFPSPYAGPHFMALPLTASKPHPAPCVYAAAFDKLR